MRPLVLMLAALLASCASTPEPEIRIEEFRAYPETAILIMRTPDNGPNTTFSRRLHRVDTTENRFWKTSFGETVYGEHIFNVSRGSGEPNISGDGYIAVLMPAGDYVLASETMHLLASSSINGGRRVLSSSVTCFSEGAPLYHLEPGSINFVPTPYRGRPLSMLGEPRAPAPPIDAMFARLSDLLNEAVDVEPLAPSAIVQFGAAQSLLTGNANCPRSAAYTLLEN